MRILIADFKNAHFKYPGGAVEYQDIFKLSYDTAVVREKISDEDWQKIIDKRISKKNKNGHGTT